MLKNLTVVILTDRSDEIFKQCLKSALFAEEILIFDYQSGNQWTKLPYKNLKVVKKNNRIEDFSTVRNEAIKLVKTDWLLMLDSDEILPKNAEATISKLIGGLEINTNVDAYQIKREDIFYNRTLKYGETGKFWTTRLAKKDNISYQRFVHEEALIDGEVKKTNLIIKHHAHQNLKEFFASINNYANLEASFRCEKKWSYSKLKWVLEFFFFPNLKFLQNYILKLGLLDGLAGFNYALMMSLHSLLVRVYLYEKYFLN